MSIKIFTIRMTVLLSLLVVGCDSRFSSQKTDLNREMMTIHHQQGVTKIPINPQKVVVFNIATLDILDALDVPIAGLPKTSSHLPTFLKKYNRDHYFDAGTLFEPNYEKLAEFTPDLILAGGRATDAYDKLNQIAPTISLDIDTKDFIESLTKRTLQLGRIFNKQAVAEEKLTAFKKKVTALKNKVIKSNKTALVIMVNAGRISVFGSKSRFGFIFDVLGFKPAAELDEAAQHGHLVNAEFLLKSNPDWLFVIDRDKAIGVNNGQPAKQVLDNQLISSINAVKQKQIFYLDSTATYIAGGLQTYDHLVRQLNHILDKK